MKIFCIGFQKTGTTSLGRALEILGYKVCGPIGVTNPQIQDKALEWALQKIPHHDAFQDNPWPLLYRELDRMYPGSKFILTTRKPRAWLRSMKKYFGNYEAAAESWIYGEGITPLKNPLKCMRIYRMHNQAVRQYFKDRPDDLLEIDLSKGDPWPELCAFLGQPVPMTAFPRSNKSGTIEAEAQRHAVGIYATALNYFHRFNRNMLITLQKFFGQPIP